VKLLHGLARLWLEACGGISEEAEAEGEDANQELLGFLASGGDP